MELNAILYRNERALHSLHTRLAAIEARAGAGTGAGAGAGTGAGAGAGAWRLRALLASPGMRPKVVVLGLRLLLFGGAILLLIFSSAGGKASVRVEIVAGKTVVQEVSTASDQRFRALSYPAYAYQAFVGVALLVANGVFLGLGGVELWLVGGGLEGESRRYRIDRLAPVAGVCIDFLLFLFTFSSSFSSYGLTSTLLRVNPTPLSLSNQTAVAELEKDLAWEVAASTLMLLAHGLVGACLILGWLYVVRQRRDALAPLGGGWVLATFTWITDNLGRTAAEISKSRKYVSLKFVNRCIALLFALGGVAFGRAMQDLRDWGAALPFVALFYLSVLFLVSSILMVTANVRPRGPGQLLLHAPPPTRDSPPVRPPLSSFSSLSRAPCPPSLTDPVRCNFVSVWRSSGTPLKQRQPRPRQTFAGSLGSSLGTTSSSRCRFSPRPAPRRAPSQRREVLGRRAPDGPLWGTSRWPAECWPPSA